MCITDTPVILANVRPTYLHNIEAALAIVGSDFTRLYHKKQDLIWMVSDKMHYP